MNYATIKQTHDLKLKCDKTMSKYGMDAKDKTKLWHLIQEFHEAVMYSPPSEPEERAIYDNICKTFEKYLMPARVGNKLFKDLSILASKK